MGGGRDGREGEKKVISGRELRIDRGGGLERIDGGRGREGEWGREVRGKEDGQKHHDTNCTCFP